MVIQLQVVFNAVFLPAATDFIAVLQGKTTKPNALVF